MAKDILGVEISTRKIKLVQVSQGKPVRYSEKEVPDGCVRDGLIVTWDAMEEVLRDAVKEGHFSTKKAAIVIPDTACYVRRLVLPVMTESQLMVNIPYEFRDVIQDDKDHYTFDYSMIGLNYVNEGDEKPNEMEMLGAAIQNDTLNHYMTLFARAGLKLVKATPRIMALQQLVCAISEDNLTHDIAILDLGFHETKVDIFHNGNYEATRSIDEGMESVANAVAEKLNCDAHIARQYLVSNHENVLASDECKDVYSHISVEIMRAINYYTYENPDNNLEKLYYNGFGSWIQPFIQEIANSVSLTLIPLSSFDEEEQEALLNGATAIGVCLD
jgi:type IV pilus assembly protein PilM